MTIPQFADLDQATNDIPRDSGSGAAGRGRGPVIGLLVFLLLLVGFFSVFVQGFASGDNASNVAQQMVVLGIVAAGSTLVIVSGGLDLSVGATAALAGVVAALVARDGLLGGSSLAAWAAGVVVGAIVGLINGFIITGAKINPLITTLGMQTIVRGVAFLITGGLSLFGVPEAFQALGRGYLLPGISYAVATTIAVFLLCSYALSQTRMGRYIYAIGGNLEAARESGVPVVRVTTWVYVISGTCAGLAGVVLASRLGSGQAASSIGLELTVITAVVLGGAPIVGGDGRILATFLGVAVLAVLANGLILMNVSEFYQLIVRGVTLLIAVGLGQISRGTGLGQNRLFASKGSQ